jgi:hypothetical protein
MVALQASRAWKRFFRGIHERADIARRVATVDHVNEISSENGQATFAGIPFLADLILDRQPLEVVGLCSRCLLSSGFGLYTSWTRWSMVALSRT